MWQIFVFISIITCSSLEVHATSMFSWFWGKSKESTAIVADGVPLVSIPYELMTEDEKFLHEAAKFTNIQVASPLEVCQHKVIMKIKTTCNEMSEEQLAKLSVNLLNCQSAVEGRKMFPCTDEMSLKQCTTDMDADMWNTYHLMSNRARAVCYASRSTQFRALTELTVNKLMKTAHSQVETLQSLKESQNRLEEQTIEALNSLSKGNEALLKQQELLKNAQASAHSLVSANLRQLSNEKSLIRAGHQQLALMTENINIQLDKIESITNRIILQNKEAAERYGETLKKLEQVNATINFIWNMTNTMRVEIDEKLEWITSYIGNTGEQIEKIYLAFLHIVYMLISMVLSAFLQAPLLIKISIVTIIPINLVTYWKHGVDASLDFISITALILSITGIHFTIIGIQYVLRCILKNNSTNKYKRETHPTDNKFISSNYNSVSHEKCSTIDISLYQRTLNRIIKLMDYIMNQTSYMKARLELWFKSTVFLKKQKVTPREILVRSCSYVPSRKMQDSIANDDKELSWNLSDDFSIEYCNSSDQYTYIENDDTINNYVIRHRRDYRSPSSRVFDNVSSRSTSPSLSRKCNAYTKNGTRCRSVVAKGCTRCHRHLSSISIEEDEI